MRIILDTDPGMGTVGTDPEDGMAILFALNSPGVSVEGITLVQGNVPISHSWPAASHLLSVAGRDDVPLHAGATGPRAPQRRRLQAAWLAQRGGMRRSVPERDPPGETAASFLRETVLTSPGQITVVAIGPLTNLAAAVEADPEVGPALAGIVIMGGTVGVPGNITPAAEFNIWMDPEAADEVFACGAPITMVGLDVCHRTRFSRDRIAALRGHGSELGELVASSAESWLDVRENLFEDDEGLHLYDTLAVAAAIEPDLLEYRSALVEVEVSEGPAQGMTVTYLDDVLRMLLTGREQNARVAVDVDTRRFDTLFDERVLSRL